MAHPGVVAESEKPRDATGDESETEKPADPMAAIMEMMKKFDERLTAIEQGVAKNAAAEAAETTTETTGDDDKPLEVEDPKDETEKAESKTGDEEDPAEKKDEKKGTMDAASIGAEILDVKARAEIIVPGVRFPTFDAKDAKVRDSLCAFRRRVLRHSITQDSPSAKVIKPLLAGRDVKSLTCDAVNVAFVAASESMKALNNGRDRPVLKGRTFAAQTQTQLADMNKRNAEFWGDKR